MSRWHRLPKCITQHVREPSFSNMHKQRKCVESGSTRLNAKWHVLVHSILRIGQGLCSVLTHHMVLLADSVIQTRKTRTRTRTVVVAIKLPSHKNSSCVVRKTTKLPARKEAIISLLLSFPLGFLRGKNKFSSSHNVCHDFSRYISFLLLIQPFQSYAHPTSPIPSSRAPSHPWQLHPSSPKHQKKKKRKKLPPSILQIPTIPPRIFTLRSITRFIMPRQPQPSHLSTIRRTPLLPIRRPFFCISSKFITGAIESFFC